MFSDYKIKNERTIFMPKNLTNRQKKSHLIDRLVEVDIKAAEQVIDMKPSDFLSKIPDISSEELRLFLDLQDVVKNGSLYNWICSE